MIVQALPRRKRIAENTLVAGLAVATFVLSTALSRVLSENLSCREANTADTAKCRPRPHDVAPRLERPLLDVNADVSSREMTGEGRRPGRTTSPLLLGSELARDDAEGSGECSASCHKRLVHLVVNAILYAASYSHAWPALVSPVKALRRSAKGMGDQGRQRIEKRALELASTRSAEDVFHLPGKIPISQLRALQQMERSSSGRLLARCMVRGHCGSPLRVGRRRTIAGLSPTGRVQRWRRSSNRSTS